MKYLGILLGLFLALGSVQGQIRFGIRAGIHTGDIKGKDVLVLSQQQRDSLLIKGEEANVGFRIGGVVRVSLGDLIYLQPELVFRTANMQYRIRDAFRNTDSIRFQDENFFLIDVPILAGAKIGPFRLQAGPIASLRLDKNSDLETVENFTRSFNTAKWAFQFGVGLDLGKIAIDVNRQNFISKNEDEITISGQTFDLAGEGDFWVFALALYL